MSVKAKDKTFESEPFLNQDQFMDDDVEQSSSVNGLETSNRPVSRQYRFTFVHIHLIAFFVYVVAFVAMAFAFMNKNGIGKGLLPLPARKAIIWEARPFRTKLTDNPFTGDPRPELDEAWHNLLLNDNIRLPTKNLDDLNVQSIFLKDGSGQITSLSVFHSLHCLKVVRHMMYSEYYHSGKDQKSMRRALKHADHCVEYIREALMCKPDLSLISFRWINETAQHPDDPLAMYPTNFDNCQHECANWDSLNAWASNRVVDLAQLDDFLKPKEGLTYSEEEIQELSR